MDIDSGHSYAYNIFVFFPTYFQTQVVKSQFAIYDAVPGIIDANQLSTTVNKQKLSKNGVPSLSIPVGFTPVLDNDGLLKHNN